MSDAYLLADELLDDRAPTTEVLERLARLPAQERLQVADYLWLDGLLSSAYCDTTTLDARTARALANIQQTATDGEEAATLPMRAAWWLREKVHNTITVSMILSGLFITTILLSLALWIIPEGKHSTEAVPSRADYVARIHDMQDAEWNGREDQAEPKRNDDLLLGQRLDLASGYVRVRYDNGTMVLLEGPVQFVLEGENAGRLERGKLVTRISAEAPGYELQAHRTTIVDLGTEFGAFVGEQDDVDVSVFEGKVRVEAPGGKVILNSGESAVVTPGGGIEHRQGEVLFARRLPREEPAAVQAAQPVAAVATSGAGVIATKSTGPNGTFSVLDDDAADASQGGTTTFTGSAEFGSNPAKVIDGGVYNSDAYNSTGQTLTPSVGSELILNLDPSASAGWDISSIVILTGTGSSASQLRRSHHSYTIALSTDGSTFGAPIINVNDANNALEVQVTVFDNSSPLLGTGIKAVKFVFGNATGEPENMYREIDVVAKASSTESIKTRKSTSEREKARPSKVLD